MLLHPRAPLLKFQISNLQSRRLTANSSPKILASAQGLLTSHSQFRSSTEVSPASSQRLMLSGLEAYHSANPVIWAGIYMSA
jgi:hypothetical protein